MKYMILMAAMILSSLSGMHTKQAYLEGAEKIVGEEKNKILTQPLIVHKHTLLFLDGLPDTVLSKYIDEIMYMNSAQIDAEKKESQEESQSAVAQRRRMPFR